MTGRNGEPAGLPAFSAWDIGHPDYVAWLHPDSAFWSLVRKDQPEQAATGGALHQAFTAQAADFTEEMRRLRFGLKPSAVYFNPTERCNLDCSYCYIPRTLRKDGGSMDRATLLDALERLAGYFATTMPEGRKPQVIFHGAEPLIAKEPLFAGIEAFKDRFRFGVQTNATLLDQHAIEFLTGHGVGIGLSLDAPNPEQGQRTRKRWNGEGVHQATLAAIDRLRGYKGFNVICTMTQANIDVLGDMVEFLHSAQVPACMLNVVRCTLPGAREVRADDAPLSAAYLAALERSWQLYRQTGRKLVVANFANVLIGILAPTARRLMCDISPCGGGRSFFAVAPDGDLFPCSEFIGLPSFAGGNLFQDKIEDVLQSPAFKLVTGRKVEDVGPCAACDIRHFCGSPCPAEAHEMNGGMDRVGAYCDFYKEQTNYAFRLIADNRHQDFLWDGWDDGTEVMFTG
ncbi:MAG: peptide-modifying radical SAM enzyme CbpB [Alphaproteobacteria bacterium]|nr:peptide-modifying radical SAM enzyme CbpB [Alphaproteobacteria bacterium]